MSINSSSVNSDSLSPYTRLQMESHDDSFVVPSLTQEAAFALIDDFYPSPSRPTDPEPEFDDADFADMMENLDEIEMNTQPPYSNVCMSDASSPPREASSVLPAFMAASCENVRNEPPQASSTPDVRMLDATPIPHSARKNPFMSRSTNTSSNFAAAAQVTEEDQHEQTPTVTELPVSDVRPAKSSPQSVDGYSPATLPELHMPNVSPVESSSSLSDGELLPTSPTLPFAPMMTSSENFQTPAPPRSGLLIGSVRTSSVAPSTGGHRSSMQSEMRQEEIELASEDLGELPPFPGFQASGGPQSGRTVDSLLSEDHRQEIHDLSSSRDIGDIEEVRGAALAEYSPKQASSLPSMPHDRILESRASSPPGPALRKDSAQVEPPLPEDLPPGIAPAIKKRHVPWDPTSEPSQNPAQEFVEALKPKCISESFQKPARKNAKGTKSTRFSEESQSSLSEISLSAFPLSSPDHLNEPLSLRTGIPPLSNKQGRRDSFVAFPNGSKPKVPSSPAKDGSATEQNAAKPKAAPKRKRDTAAASGASPGPTKPAKIAKTRSSARNKNSTPIGKDLKGIIGAGILGDVLKDKGPRLTRNRKKEIEKNKPNAALVAKGRHIGHVDYKE